MTRYAKTLRNMMKPRILILLNFLAIAAFLQIAEVGPAGRNNRIRSEFGRPFVIVQKNWTSDWDPYANPERKVNYEYEVSFNVTSLLINAAIIGAVALVIWFFWRKARPAGPEWSKSACWIYALSSLGLVTINIWFAIAHKAHDSNPLQGGEYASGWPAATLVVYDDGRSFTIVTYADTLNGMIIFCAPLVLALVSEGIVRSFNKRHKKQMPQTPDGAGDP